jgi:hypothetical protein
MYCNRNNYVSVLQLSQFSDIEYDTIWELVQTMATDRIHQTVVLWGFILTPVKQDVEGIIHGVF